MRTQSPYLLVSYAETNRVFPDPYQRVVVAVIVVAICCTPLVAGSYFLHLMNLCSIAVIGAVGINLLTGYCGQLSLGQASFLAIGAFTTAILSQRFGMPFFVAIPAS
jgi:branched-chain amino acid transport system permease protein